MSQYKVAKMIFESESGLSVDQIKKRTGNVESTVRTSLHKLESKKIIREHRGVYRPHPEATGKDLEKVRSYTIDELRDKD